MPTQPETPAALQPTPEAWIGWKADYKTGELFVRVCARCHDKHLAELEAQRLRCRVTHSLCDRHFLEEMEKLTGEYPI